MSMTEFEMRFHWDDQKQAYYSKTPTFRQDGMLKTWKLENETDEQYQKRTREAIQRKVKFLNKVRQFKNAQFTGIDSCKFR